jgi:hypothetical protein
VYHWLDHVRSGSRNVDFNRDELVQLKALASAALRDIAGLSEPAIAEWIDSREPVDAERRVLLLSGNEPDLHADDTSSIRRRIRTGRLLWVNLAAWPWWPIVIGGDAVKGGLPKQWWEMKRVTETYATWLRLRPDGTLRPAEILE